MDSEMVHIEERPTLLFVDDDPGVVAAIRRVLRGEPYRFLAATGGHEGLELLGRYRAQVIVSDHRMPRLTGTDFLERAMSLDPATVRIVLSGHAEEADIARALAAGVIHWFLAKPWEPDALRALLRQAFEHQRRLALAPRPSPAAPA